MMETKGVELWVRTKYLVFVLCIIWYHNPKKEDLKALNQLQKTQEIDGKNIGSETADVTNIFFHDNIIPCMYYNNHKLLSLSSNYKKKPRGLQALTVTWVPYWHTCSPQIDPSEGIIFAF